MALKYGSKKMPKLESLYLKLEDLNKSEREQTPEEMLFIAKSIAAGFGGRIRYVKSDGSEVDGKHVYS